MAEEGSEYQRILEENVELRKALDQLKDRHLKMKCKNRVTVAERDDIERFYVDLKKHYQAQQKELEDGHAKLLETIQSKKELQANFESQLAQWRHSFDLKQREMEEIQHKVMQPMDADLIRLKMEKEIESTYMKELDSKQNQIERLQENFSTVNKQYELIKSRYEELKYESDRELQEMRDRHRIELNDYLQENLQLQTRLDDSKDKDIIRNMRRELEEHRRRTNEYQNEATDMRRERDALKLEKNELIIGHSRELEIERNARRSLQADHERREFQTKVMEEDLKKEISKNEKKTGELNALLNQKQATHALLKQKDLLNEALRKQVAEQKDTIRAKERELQESIRKMSEDQRDRFLIDKKEKSKLQKEIECAQRMYQEVEHKRRTEITLCQQEYEKLQNEKQRLQQNNRDLQHTLGELQDKHETLKKVLDNQMDQYDMIDKEYKRLQDKHRELLNNEAELVRVKEHLEESVKMLQKEKNIQEQEIHHARISIGNENRDLQGQVHQLASNLDRVKGDSQNEMLLYKKKYLEYKHKLKLANLKITDFGQRLARLQNERIAMHGGLIPGEYDQEDPQREDQEQDEQYMVQQTQLQQQLQRMNHSNQQYLDDLGGGQGLE